MTSPASLYDILGLPADATTEQINAAYRRAAKAAHPDAGGDVDSFSALQRAVAVLRDPDARAHYDRTGDAESAVPDPFALMSSTLCQTFHAVLLSAPDILHVDLIQEVRKNLRAAGTSSRQNGAQQEKLIEKMQKALARLTFSASDKPNFIEAMVLSNIAQAETHHVKILLEQENIDAALEYLELYAYETDAAEWDAPVQSSYLQWSTP